MLIDFTRYNGRTIALFKSCWFIFSLLCLFLGYSVTAYSLDSSAIAPEYQADAPHSKQVSYSEPTYSESNSGEIKNPLGTKQTEQVKSAAEQNNNPQPEQHHGTLGEKILWAASGSPYIISSDLVVEVGTELTLEPGVELQFDDGVQMIVNGTLFAQGTAENPIVFHSSSANPTKGKWDGIFISDTSISTMLSHVTIEWAKKGVAVERTSVVIKDNIIQNYSDSGIHMSKGATGTISGNLIDKSNGLGKGIHLINSSLPIHGNTISNNTYGIYIYGESAPSISGGNEIVDNHTGIYVMGYSYSDSNPAPVVNGNRIYNNTSYNYFTRYFKDGLTTVLDATGNWWGSTDPLIIADKIYDYTDSASGCPIVDFDNYLDGPNGNPASTENELFGQLSSNKTLTSGTTYGLGRLVVPEGVTLTIEAGTTLRAYRNSQLIVDGTLLVQGTETNPVQISSGAETPTEGIWEGIKINTTSINSVIEHAIIDWAKWSVHITEANVAIRNSTIRSFGEGGIYLRDVPTANISGNLIDNIRIRGRGIDLYNSSPLISGNIIQNSHSAIFVNVNSNPLITGNNEITSNSYGIYVSGHSYTPEKNPNPVVTGNSIYSNTYHNYYASSFGDAHITTLDARGNWWGSDDSVIIADGIFDITENNSSSPIVDFNSYLDAAGGSTVSTENDLYGQLVADKTLSSGTIYGLGYLQVPEGITLTIEPGTILRTFRNARLIIDGTLIIQGTEANPVQLTSGLDSPFEGSWEGIQISTTSTNSIIDYATIEWAKIGISVTTADVNISNSTVRNFSSRGIKLSEGATGNINRNLIENIRSNYFGIDLRHSSPLITGNIIRNVTYGIYVGEDSNPVINGGNEITSSNYGIYVSGNPNSLDHDPAPIVNGNSIYNNSYNYYVKSFGYGLTTVLDATGNWWGSTEPITITNGIYDLTENADGSPAVNFNNYLDGPNGAPVAGVSELYGLLSENKTLISGTSYNLGRLIVPEGITLTIEAGAKLYAHKNGQLVINGTLIMQGSEANPVEITSGSSSPTRGIWGGIKINATSTNSLIDYVAIEWANRGIAVTAAEVVISNNKIYNFGDSGIFMSEDATGSISKNLIKNIDKRSRGIYLYGASPDISGNIIRNVSTGINISQKSTPVISNNAIIYNNYGITLAGAYNDDKNPNPTITGNDIFGNTYAQLRANSYGASLLILDITGNWWGTTSPQIGNEILLSNSTSESVINFSNFLTMAVTGAVSNDFAIDQNYFTTTDSSAPLSITGTLTSDSSWTLKIKNSTGEVVKTIDGSGDTIEVEWNGSNNVGQVQADGVYNIVLSTLTSGRIAFLDSLLIELDSTLPVADIDDNLNGAILKNTPILIINGSANDKNIEDYQVEYGQGETPSSWTIIDSSKTTAINNNTLVEWLVNSSDGTLVTPNGIYSVRLSVTDLAGNTSSDQILITLDFPNLTDVSHTPSLLYPKQGEQFDVSFTLGSSANVALRIFSEQTGELIYETSKNFTSGGNFILSWDGKDTTGAYVADEAYSYILYANNGSGGETYYNPPFTETEGSGSGGIDSSYNAHRNDFWQKNYTMYHNGLVRLKVTPSGRTPFYPINWVPYPAGTHLLSWDGRDLEGNLVTGSVSIYYDPPARMKSNLVFVRGVNKMLSIQPANESLNIEIKSNPFLVVHSYEQFSQIAYRINQDAYVTVKLLPPGIVDPTSSEAIVLINGELQQAADNTGTPIDQLVEWRGYDLNDTNNILTSEEGTYTFTIEATSVATNLSALYRGALQLHN